MRLLKKYGDDPNTKHDEILQLLSDEKSPDRWTDDEIMKFIEAVKFYGIKWPKI